jgi:hypothetical protein
MHLMLVWRTKNEQSKIKQKSVHASVIYTTYIYVTCDWCVICCYGLRKLHRWQCKLRMLLIFTYNTWDNLCCNLQVDQVIQGGPWVLEVQCPHNLLSLLWVQPGPDEIKYLFNFWNTYCRKINAVFDWVSNF